MREGANMVLVKFKGNALERENKLDVFDPSSKVKWHWQNPGEK